MVVELRLVSLEVDGSYDAGGVQGVGRVSRGYGRVQGLGRELCGGRGQGSEVGLAVRVGQFLSSDQLGNMDIVNTEIEKIIPLILTSGI